MGFVSAKSQKRMSSVLHPLVGTFARKPSHPHQLFSSDDPTSSTVSSEDSNSHRSDSLLWSNVGGGGAEDAMESSRPPLAYNFDQYSAEETKPIKETVPSKPHLPSKPLPILDQQSYVKLAALSSSSSSPQARSMVTYRWNMDNVTSGGSDDTDRTHDVFRPFFTFAKPSEDDENMDCSASTSLLHGDNRSHKSVFKPSVTASCFTPFNAPRIPFRRKKDMEGSVSLMHESTALSNDWSERQLAFDLEVVEDDPTSMDVTWTMHQPKDIVIEKSHIAIGNSWYLLPQALLPLTVGTPKPPELQIQHTMYDGLIRGARSSRHSNGSASSNKKPSLHHRKLSSTGSSGRSKSCSLDPKSRKSSSRRRGSPVLRGRQFSPNLSTVPERPSEEDASYSLTPRNDSATTTPNTWSL